MCDVSDVSDVYVTPTQRLLLLQHGPVPDLRAAARCRCCGLTSEDTVLPDHTAGPRPSALA